MFTYGNRYALAAYDNEGAFAGWYAGGKIDVLTYNILRACWSPTEASAQEVLTKSDVAAHWPHYTWLIEPLPRIVNLPPADWAALITDGLGDDHYDRHKPYPATMRGDGFRGKAVDALTVNTVHSPSTVRPRQSAEAALTASASGAGADMAHTQDVGRAHTQGREVERSNMLKQKIAAAAAADNAVTDADTVSVKSTKKTKLVNTKSPTPDGDNPAPTREEKLAAARAAKAASREGAPAKSREGAAGRPAAEVRVSAKTEATPGARTAKSAAKPAVVEKPSRQAKAVAPKAAIGKKSAAATNGHATGKVIKATTSTKASGKADAATTVGPLCLCGCGQRCSPGKYFLKGHIRTYDVKMRQISTGELDPVKAFGKRQADKMGFTPLKRGGFKPSIKHYSEIRPQ